MLMNILSKLGSKIKYRLVNYANKSKAPTFIYKFLFDIDCYKGIKKLIRKNNLFIIEEIINNHSHLWSFPYELKERGRRLYLKGLEFRSKQICECYLLNNIEFEDNDLVIDCGANFGDLYLFLNSLKNRFNYFGIEPGKIEFEALKFNTENKNSIIKIKLFNIAFGKEKSEMELFYSPLDANSSLIEPPDYDTKYKVDVQTIDQFIIQNKIKGKKIKLLKLEAEGFEPEILQGCQNNLENIEYISADLGPERGVKKECTLVEVTNLLVSKGFKLIDFKYSRSVILFKNNLFCN